LPEMATHCSTSSTDLDIDSERLADMIYGYGIVASIDHPESVRPLISQKTAKSQIPEISRHFSENSSAKCWRLYAPARAVHLSWVCCKMPRKLKNVSASPFQNAGIHLHRS
jgi:hypothetical protein